MSFIIEYFDFLFLLYLLHDISAALLVPPSKPLVQRLSDSAVKLNWTVPISKENVDVLFFRIQYKRIKPEREKWKTSDVDINNTQRSTTVSRLKTDSLYKFRVAAVYVNKDNRVGPTRRFYLHSYNPLNIPQNKPFIIQLSSKQKNGAYSLSVKWRYRQQRKMRISGFNIQYRPYYSNLTYSVIRLNNSKVRSHVIDDLIPDLDYSVRVSAVISGRSGPYSNVVVKNTGRLKTTVIPRHISSHTFVKPTYITDGLDESRHLDVMTYDPVVMVDGPSQSSSRSNRMMFIILGSVIGSLLVFLVVAAILCSRLNRISVRGDSGKNDNRENGSFLLSHIKDSAYEPSNREPTHLSHHSGRLLPMP